MISGIFIALMFVILVYSFEVFKKVRTTKIISTFIGVLIFYGLLFNITDNSDWENYEVYFNGYNETTDFLFSYISDVFSNNGYDYIAVYKFHILIMGIGFIYFASRFSFSNVFAVISCYLLFQFVPLSNQIRYYVAFTFFLISIYSLIVTKNKISFAIFAILSVLSHSAILLMYPFLYFYYKTSNEDFLGKLLLYSLLFSFLCVIIYRIGLLLFNQFTSYFETEVLSSISGGVFNNLILVVWIFYIYVRNKVLVRSNQVEIVSDIKYQFLYRLSLYSIVFIPTSIIIQIISHRYVAASVIIWVTYIMYSFKYDITIKRRILQLTIFLFLIIGSFLYFYILPEFLLGTSNLEAVSDLFDSNTLLNFL